VFSKLSAEFIGTSWLVLGGCGSDYGAHSPGQYSLAAGLLCEVVMTFMFLIVILCTTHTRAPVGFAGLAIGLALTLIHLIQHPGDEHLGQSGAQHCDCGVRRRLGSSAALAVLVCSRDGKALSAVLGSQRAEC
jgi:hypothetical protein